MALSRGAELHYLAFLEEMYPVSLTLGKVVRETCYLSYSFLFFTFSTEYRKDLTDLNLEAFNLVLNTFRFTLLHVPGQTSHISIFYSPLSNWLSLNE